MSLLKSHLEQVDSHFDFLSKINRFENFWDWKLTVPFYISVHIINAHFHIKSKKTLRSHQSIKMAMNPYNDPIPSQIDIDNYVAYIKLQDLFRKTRYICVDNEKKSYNPFSKPKHFYKSLKCLNTLMTSFAIEHSHPFTPMTLNIPDQTSSMDLTYFKFV